MKRLFATLIFVAAGFVAQTSFAHGDIGLGVSVPVYGPGYDYGYPGYGYGGYPYGGVYVGGGGWGHGYHGGGYHGGGFHGGGFHGGGFHGGHH